MQRPISSDRSRNLQNARLQRTRNRRFAPEFRDNLATIRAVRGYDLTTLNATACLVAGSQAKADGAAESRLIDFTRRCFARRPKARRATRTGTRSISSRWATRSRAADGAHSRTPEVGHRWRDARVHRHLVRYGKPGPPGRIHRDRRLVRDLRESGALAREPVPEGARRAGAVIRGNRSVLELSMALREGSLGARSRHTLD